jgi:hypothetical protein
MQFFYQHKSLPMYLFIHVSDVLLSIRMFIRFYMCFSPFLLLKSSLLDRGRSIIRVILLPDKWTEYTSTSENLEQVPVTIKYDQTGKFALKLAN